MKKFISQTKVQVGGFNPVQPPGEVRIKLSNYYYLHLISVSPGMGSPILISVFFLIPPHATLSMSPSFVAQQQWAQLSVRGGAKIKSRLVWMPWRSIRETLCVVEWKNLFAIILIVRRERKKTRRKRRRLNVSNVSPCQFKAHNSRLSLLLLKSQLTEPPHPVQASAGGFCWCCSLRRSALQDLSQSEDNNEHSLHRSLLPAHIQSIHPRGIQIILSKQRRPCGRAAGKADRVRGQGGFSFNTPGDTYAKLYQCIMQCEVTEADVDMMMVPVGLWRWWI